MDLILPEIDFAAYYAAAEPHVKVVPAETFRGEVLRSFDPDAKTSAPRMPWPKTWENFRLRDAEVTVLAGASGSGKSLMAGQIVWGMYTQGVKSLVISLEMSPARTLHRMVRQASVTGTVTPALVNESLDRLRDKLWLYAQHGDVPPECIYGAIRFAVVELGVRFIVIDNLAKVVAGEDDFNKQKDFISTLTGLAVELGCHVLVVHHLRKGQDEYSIPGKHDLKGTGAISDMADNVLLLFRNKRKEHDLKSGEHVPPEEADSYLICCKQRNAEGEDDEPRLKFWFHRPSQQFCETVECEPTSQFLVARESF